MRTKIVYAVLVVLAAILLFTACSGSSQTAAPSSDESVYDEAAATSGGEMPLLQEPTVAYVVEPYALGIVFPTNMAWAPDGRLFVTEKSGIVRVISAKGELQEKPVIELPTNQEGEQGLLGIAIDPNYEENHYIWVYHTWSDPDSEYDRPMHRVVRFEEHNGKGKNPEVAWMVEDAFPESTILNGGEIGFGHDGMLYVSPGSSNNILSTNDPESPQGKIHRMTPTVPAEPAPDNPNPDSTTWAYGLRNSYGFTFHPVTGEMYATENGPDCDDEINRILPGKHYGWRIDGLCEDTNLPPEYPEIYEPPIVSWTPPISPTGIMFYTGDVFEKWHNNMFYCAYNLGRMYYIKLDEDGVGIIGGGTVETAPARCAVAISTGPDGYIYFSDLNGIYRVVPPNVADLD